MGIPATAGGTHGRAYCSNMGPHTDLDAGMPLDVVRPVGTGSREHGHPCGFPVWRQLQNLTAEALAAGDHRSCVRIKELHGRIGQCGPRAASQRRGWPSGRRRGGGGG
jgi:hypothetical protein